MNINISPDFKAKGIDVSLGMIEADVSIKLSSKALIEQLEHEGEQRRLAFGNDPASKDPQIALTRKAYKAFGKDPARYRPAAESLTRRLLQGKGIYHLNNVVDVNNLISIKSGISIGTYLSDKIEGDVTFRRAGEGESYAGIGRAELNLEGLPVFSDNLGPFGCPTSDSERTKILEGEHAIVMVLICFGDAQELPAYLEEAAGLLGAHCSAKNTQVSII